MYNLNMKKERIPHAQTRQENRERLLAAARHVFATLGYDASTVRDIVRESGLAQGSFYKNFDSKQAIFEVVLDQIMEPLVPILRQRRRSATAASDFLHNAYEACRNLPAQNAETTAIIARNQTIFRDVFYYAGSQALIRADLVKDLRDWSDRGVFRDMDFDLVADAMISLGLDLVIQSARQPEFGDRRVAFLSELFMPVLVGKFSSPTNAK